MLTEEVRMILRSTLLFEDWSDADIDFLASAAIVRNYGSNTEIQKSGEKVNCLSMIKSGEFCFVHLMQFFLFSIYVGFLVPVFSSIIIPTYHYLFFNISLFVRHCEIDQSDANAGHHDAPSDLRRWNLERSSKHKYIHIFV